MKHIISLGAGVQSSTMALMAAHGELGFPVDAAVFADTGNEPAAVYEWLEWLIKMLPFKVHTVSGSRRGSLMDRSLAPRTNQKTGETYYQHFIPTYTINPDGTKGHMMRKCTHDFKLVPIYKFLRWAFNIQRGEKILRGYSLIGISLDEIQRIKPAKYPWVENVYPLIDKRMTRNHCLAWMREHKYPIPPKSACTFCPYHDDAKWLEMKKNAPEEFAQAVKFERDMQAIQEKQGIKGKEFLHSSRVPLDEVAFKVSAKHPDLFTNECEGMCGV